MNNVIIGNWKMFKTLEDIKKFKKEFYAEIKKQKPIVEYGIAVPSIYLLEAKKIFKKDKKMHIYAQDAHYKNEGAFTGNISYTQLIDCNIEGSIIGHSERREMFNDTDETINLKTKTLLENDLTVILCVGESLQTYEKKKSVEFVLDQIKKDLKDIDKNLLKKLIIAYEPIWAIGTGKVPTVEEVDNMLLKIRNEIEKLYDSETASNIKIQYGGSVNLKNVKDFMKAANVNGALVGSASLDGKNFAELLINGGK
ncbi:triose-phosphate isomerase [Malacoplasma iowae]|uniref:Triosephosphate isomerase n=1 Tax=Malacoplasma iowae DK-CPA TaxID=1394179 RepID=A0A084U3N0_MALIO|nr:triose-phosphate isomerase [Malacoplasma iowae]KFB07566.1 triosephosphate isomerase [Malacoplasma iowae DK-CPA]WPL36365.1 triose-phosphate isomerase [Malacoplasma iowae]WPL37471.1 triose-phosphate isomerase [Malacoplasma iowae]WPL38533.1 triose-phosphate isomerase [Malacoplasma iowae]WPL40972.1 triose-phosphate isomerase [Malacoplasma iowae]